MQFDAAQASALARHLARLAGRCRQRMVAHVVHLDRRAEEHDQHPIARIGSAPVDVPARRGRGVLADHHARIAEQEIRREVGVEHDRAGAAAEVEWLADAVRVAAVVLRSHCRHQVAACDRRRRIAHQRVARERQQADHIAAARRGLLGDESELALPDPERLPVAGGERRRVACRAEARAAQFVAAPAIPAGCRPVFEGLAERGLREAARLRVRDGGHPRGREEARAARCSQRRQPRRTATCADGRRPATVHARIPRPKMRHRRRARRPHCGGSSQFGAGEGRVASISTEIAWAPRRPRGVRRSYWPRRRRWSDQNAIAPRSSRATTTIAPTNSSSTAMHASGRCVRAARRHGASVAARRARALRAVRSRRRTGRPRSGSRTRRRRSRRSVRADSRRGRARSPACSEPARRRG